MLRCHHWEFRVKIFDLLAVITFGRTIFDVDDDFPVILLGINLGASLIPVPQFFGPSKRIGPVLASIAIAYSLRYGTYSTGHTRTLREHILPWIY